MRKCIKARFEPLQTLKISWKDAQMHQNTFLTTSDLKKYFFFQAMILVVWKYAQMHENTFFNHFRPKKLIFSGQDSGGLENLRKCIKTPF